MSAALPRSKLCRPGQRRCPGPDRWTEQATSPTRSRRACGLSRYLDGLGAGIAANILAFRTASAQREKSAGEAVLATAPPARQPDARVPLGGLRADRPQRRRGVLPGPVLHPGRPQGLDLRRGRRHDRAEGPAPFLGHDRGARWSTAARLSTRPCAGETYRGGVVEHALVEVVGPVAARGKLDAPWPTPTPGWWSGPARGPGPGPGRGGPGGWRSVRL